VQIPNPDAVDLQRPNLIRHMTFGNGPHVCVGNQLARGEIRIVVLKLLQRMQNIRYSRGEHSIVRDPHFSPGARASCTSALTGSPSSPPYGRADASPSIDQGRTAVENVPST
jgi:hypothetical protein